MSIPTPFNPLGTLGAVELLNEPTRFEHNIDGVVLAGATSSDSTRWEVEAWFDMLEIEKWVESYKKLFFLYSSPTGEGRFMFSTYPDRTIVFFENNTSQYLAGDFQNSYLKEHGNHLLISGTRANLNSQERNTRSFVYTTGASPVWPRFLSERGYTAFALERFLFKVDGVVVQEYLPARKNGVIGLYETVSKTFCK